MFRLARRLISFGLLCGLVYLAVTFVQVWQASRRDDARPAEAIVVFGAAQYNGRPSPVLRARLDHAADLYERDIAPIIVVTGGNQPGDQTNEAGASADYLRQQYGIREDAVLRETASENSWQQMASAANELRKRGMEQVVLVTDPFHAARVQAMADELGLDSRVSPTRTSPIGGTRELRHFARETVAVAAGRVVGFRRLMGVNDVVDVVRDRSPSG
ncbi:MAG TPA: YdcF family protein [Acidimicrobiales bacterium]|nr:YdcF family protein [Acidimicrobiales bacterium]